MTLHVAKAAAAVDFIDPPNRYQRMLLKRLWPGPVALMFNVSPARQAAAANSHSIELADLYHNDEITIRCPSHPVANQVLDLCVQPVAGSPPAADSTRVSDLPADVLDGVDVILDDGPTTQRKPSTVLRVHASSFDIVRPGVYDRRIIEKMLQTSLLFVCSGNT